MQVDFSNNRLEAASVNMAAAIRLFGSPLGRKYIQRIAILRATDKFTWLFGFRALVLHPLKGDRSGQYALTLNANYRLVLEKIAEDKIRIVDVEDYHGD